MPKLCKANGCPSQARGATQYCIKHGGGTRCSFPGCLNSGRGWSKRCVLHGGGGRCQYPGCSKGSAKQKYCVRHFTQLQNEEEDAALSNNNNTNTLSKRQQKLALIQMVQEKVKNKSQKFNSQRSIKIEESFSTRLSETSSLLSSADEIHSRENVDFGKEEETIRNNIEPIIETKSKRQRKPSSKFLARDLNNEVEEKEKEIIPLQKITPSYPSTVTPVTLRPSVSIQISESFPYSNFTYPTYQANYHPVFQYPYSLIPNHVTLSTPSSYQGHDSLARSNYLNHGIAPMLQHHHPSFQQNEINLYSYPNNFQTRDPNNNKPFCEP